MPRGLIELRGDDLFCVVEGSAEARLSYERSRSRLNSWSSRYDRAAAWDRRADLLAIGREMFAWLDEAGWAGALMGGSGVRELEIRVAGAEDAREAILLDAPWELLARGDVAGARSATAVPGRSAGRRGGSGMDATVSRPKAHVHGGGAAGSGRPRLRA